MASIAVQKTESQAQAGEQVPVGRKANMKRVLSLYDDAKVRKDKLAAKVKLQEDRAVASFKPEKIAKPYRRRKTATESGSAATLARATNRFDRLHLQATLSQKHKKEVEAARPVNCTFHPKLSKKSSCYKPKIAGPAGERMFKQATEAQQRRKQLEQIEGIRGCTFAPKINKKVSATRPKLYDLDGLIKKKLGLEQKRMEEEIKNCTFEPTLAPNTQKIASSSRPSSSTIYDRLHAEAKKQEEKLDSMRKALVDNTMSECTFSPEITKQRAKDASPGIDLKNVSYYSKNVSDRLYEHGVAMQERKKKALEEGGGHENYAFAKTVSTGVKTQLYDRLYKEGLSHQKKKNSAPDYKSLANARLEDMDLRECTFTPEKISTVPVGLAERRKSIVSLSTSRPTSPRDAQPSRNQSPLPSSVRTAPEDAKASPHLHND